MPLITLLIRVDIVGVRMKLWNIIIINLCTNIIQKKIAHTMRVLIICLYLKCSTLIIFILGLYWWLIIGRMLLQLLTWFWNLSTVRCKYQNINIYEISL